MRNRVFACVLFAVTIASYQALPQQKASQPTAAKERYRVVTEADGLKCTFSQDAATSMGMRLNGIVGSVYISPRSPKSDVSMWSVANHFNCTKKTGTEIEIALLNKVPNLSTDTKNGKVAIRTRDFGTIYKGDEDDTLSTYEMTESQIKKLRSFLGL
jgi:hypothetical protein